MYLYFLASSILDFVKIANYIYIALYISHTYTINQKAPGAPASFLNQNHLNARYFL